MFNLLLAAALLNAAPDAAPGPNWLREAAVYNGWYQKWTDESIARMRDMPFVVGVPLDKAVIDKAHKVGARVLTYVTYYQFPPKQKYQNATIADHPDWIIIEKDGSEAPSAFAKNPPPDNNPGWVALCPNSTTFRKYAVEYAKFMMDQGVDIGVLSVLLGHRGPQETGVYLHAFAAQRREAVRHLPTRRGEHT